MKKFVKTMTAVFAISLLVLFGANGTLGQVRSQTQKPTPRQTPPKTGDRDQQRDKDRDRDQDRDKDGDRDRDRDRDRITLTDQDRVMLRNEMMKSPDHHMSVGYQRNMLNFTEQLRNRLEQGEPGNRDFVNGAVSEIKRNFKEMEQHHNRQINQVSNENRERMRVMMQEREEIHNRIRNTIRMLENDAKNKNIDRPAMLMHTKELELQLRQMEQTRIENRTGS